MALFALGLFFAVTIPLGLCSPVKIAKVNELVNKLVENDPFLRELEKTYRHPNLRELAHVKVEGHPDLTELVNEKMHAIVLDIGNKIVLEIGNAEAKKDWEQKAKAKAKEIEIEQERQLEAAEGHRELREEVLAKEAVVEIVKQNQYFREIVKQNQYFGELVKVKVNEYPNLAEIVLKKVNEIVKEIVLKIAKEIANVKDNGQIANYIGRMYRTVLCAVRRQPELREIAEREKNPKLIVRIKDIDYYKVYENPKLRAIVKEIVLKKVLEKVLEKDREDYPDIEAIANEKAPEIVIKIVEEIEKEKEKEKEIEKVEEEVEEEEKEIAKDEAEQRSWEQRSLGLTKELVKEIEIEIAIAKAKARDEAEQKQKQRSLEQKQKQKQTSGLTGGSRYFAGMTGVTVISVILVILVIVGLNWRSQHRKSGRFADAGRLQK